MGKQKVLHTKHEHNSQRQKMKRGEQKKKKIDTRTQRQNTT